MGGLELRDIDIFNHALLAKIVWRLVMKPYCLLSKILMDKYCNKSSLLKVYAGSAISL